MVLVDCIQRTTGVLLRDRRTTPVGLPDPPRHQTLAALSRSEFATGVPLLFGAVAMGRKEAGQQKPYWPSAVVTAIVRARTLGARVRRLAPRRCARHQGKRGERENHQRGARRELHLAAACGSAVQQLAYTQHRRAAAFCEGDERRMLLPDKVTPHTLRRTFASLALAAGRDPRWVMGQLGHTDARLTLNVYAQVMQRQRVDESLIWQLMRFPDEPETKSPGPLNESRNETTANR